MDAVVKEEKDSGNDGSNMIEPKQEVDESWKVIEPKVEVIEENDVKIEEVLDEDEYQHMIPYEYRDYLEQHTEEQQSVNSRKRPADTTYPERLECQKCRPTIKLHSYTSAENHAATHVNIYRFSCPVTGCDFKRYMNTTVTYHMKNVHNLFNANVKDVVRRELSNEEDEQLRNMMIECFPDVIRVKKACSSSIMNTFNCQICNCSISESSWEAKTGRRNHALTHTDIVLYECFEPNCNFKTKCFVSYRQHQMCIHNIAAWQVSQVQVEQSIEQKLEVERMIVQCFPELKDELESEIKRLETKIEKREEMEHRKSNISRRQSCDVCHRAIHPSDIASKGFRRFHALTHTDIKLYKCGKANCGYKANWEVEITKHQRCMHHKNIGHIPIKKIKLTKEEEMEIEEMMFQCFPEWKDE